MPMKSKAHSNHADELNTLYDNLKKALGESFHRERFNKWVAQYERPSRIFHNVEHMLTMSQLENGLTATPGPNNAATYSMVAGFFHDADYPSIQEELTAITAPTIREYVGKELANKDGALVETGRKVTKPLKKGDIIGKMVYDIFGFSEGQLLSPMPLFPSAQNPSGNPGGMNEFYCALAAAQELKNMGKSLPFIAAVVTGIEATIPFRKPERMNQLRERLEKVNENRHLGMDSKQIDEIMIAATHTANKDVSGFLGGLDPLDPNAKPTPESVVETIRGGDMLSPEEVAALRVEGDSPTHTIGDYNPRDFLDARIKRAGLYHLVINGDPKERTIPNLFFETKLSDGSTYPPEDWAGKANKLAYENNVPVRTAEYARLISAGLVNALTVQAIGDPKAVKVKDLLSGLSQSMRVHYPPPLCEPERQLAFACVNGRKVTNYDLPRSAISELIISKLSVGQVEELGKAARVLLVSSPPPTTEQIAALNKRYPDVFTPEDTKETAFLKLASNYLGATVQKIRDDIAASTMKNDVCKGTAVRLREVKLPQTLCIE